MGGHEILMTIFSQWSCSSDLGCHLDNLAQVEDVAHVRPEQVRL